jgi:hypothetical protein
MDVRWPRMDNERLTTVLTNRFRRAA